MRTLASFNLSHSIVEIRLVKIPYGVRRVVKIVNTPQNSVTIAIPDSGNPLESRLSVETDGLTLFFTYTGPSIPPRKLVGSSLTLTVPRTFRGFIDTV